MAIKTVYEYYAENVAPRELNKTLNSLGKDGWRLHTCEFRAERLDYIVVMDRMYIVDDGQDPYEEEPSPGLAMRG